MVFAAAYSGRSTFFSKSAITLSRNLCGGQRDNVDTSVAVADIHPASIASITQHRKSRLSSSSVLSVNSLHFEYICVCTSPLGSTPLASLPPPPSAVDSLARQRR